MKSLTDKGEIPYPEGGPQLSIQIGYSLFLGHAEASDAAS